MESSPFQVTNIYPGLTFAVVLRTSKSQTVFTVSCPPNSYPENNVESIEGIKLKIDKTMDL
jgi:hypothetical protein